MEATLLLSMMPAAFALDLLLGDPPRLPHPVRWMGRAIQWAEPRFRRLSLPTVLCGALFAASLVGGVWLLAAALVRAARALHPAAATGMQVVMLYYCLSVRGLGEAALDVLHRLQTGGLPAARQALAMIVGRDVASLDAAGIRRALVETVAENFVDGVASPLFYAALGGAPLALAYKMVNTLDSMVGYRNTRYAQFGKAAARLDDAANCLPARLTVPVIALAVRLLGGPARCSLATAFRQGRRHTSPNAGFPEAAFAGALGVRLNGPGFYGGRPVQKPWLCPDRPDPGSGEVRRAVQLMGLASLLWLAACLLLQAALAWGAGL